MSWDHPLLAGGMDLLLGSEKGNSAVAAAEGLKGFLLQAVFLLECVAPPRLEAGRFLPPTPISILLKDDGREAAQRPPRLRDGPPLQLAGAAARIQSLLATARERAAAQVPAIQKQAQAEMRASLGAEPDRLRALRKVNELHIRPEIAALEQRVASSSRRSPGAPRCGAADCGTGSRPRPGRIAMQHVLIIHEVADYGLEEGV